MIKTILTIALVVNMGYQVPSPPAQTKTMDPVELIKQECKLQDVDADLALAIARLETGHFTSAAYRSGNNFGGLSLDEVPISYSSKDDGVKAFVKNLKEGYIMQGLDSPEEISNKYCPVNAENWAETVKELMTWKN